MHRRHALWFWLPSMAVVVLSLVWLMDRPAPRAGASGSAQSPVARTPATPPPAAATPAPGAPAAPALTRVANPRREFPNFDRRQVPVGEGAKQAALAGPRAERVRAAEELAELVPGLRVDFDATLGSPKFIGSTQGFLATPSGRGGAVSAARLGQFAEDDRQRVVKAFLEEQAAVFGFGAEALTGTRLIRDYETPHNGMRTIVWQQELEGVRVFESTLQAHLTKTGELINVASRLVPDPEKAAEDPAQALVHPAVDVKTAISAAAKSVGEELPPAQIAENAPPVGATRKQEFRSTRLLGVSAEYVWLPLDEATLRLCWEVIFTSKGNGEMFRALVDATTGEVVVRQGLTEHISPASYRVFLGDSPTPMSPGAATPSTTQPQESPRTLVTLSAFDINASPNGWIDDGINETRGNNVDAHLDLNADDVADTPRPQGSPDRVFDFPLNLTQAPSAYRDAAVTNLFYWNNYIHDRYYQLGFTEAAGNFQNNNFGRGGFGNDAVQADAQDGSGTNNANFSTPPDGSPGRMQMYVFTGPNPDRDGDFDQEIVIHEYTHGLSNRLVGGGIGISALQTRGMGEGWSDFYGLCLLGAPADDPNGVYAAGAYASYQLAGLTQNYYFGIRRYPYSTDLLKNPLTLKDLDPAQISAHAGVPKSPIAGGTADQVHNQGELWCVTLWEARALLIARHGATAGNDLILQLVTDGMKLAPANPNFLQARDAILQADLVNSGGANRGDLWSAFSKRGMGASATSPGSFTTSGIVENFDLPDALTVNPKAPTQITGTAGGPFTPGTVTYTLQNTSAEPLDWTLSEQAPWLAVSENGGTLAAGASVTVIATLLPATNALPIGDHSATLLFTNTTSGLAQQRAIAIHVEPLMLLIASENWESGSAGPAWTITGTNTHRTLVTTSNGPRGGSYHLTMDSSTDLSDARNEATWTVDLTGRSNVQLRFWLRMYNDEPNGPPPSPFIGGANFDGVAISADGTTWYEVQPLRTYVGSYTRFVVDLDAAIAARGLAYNASFKIRFNHFDNYTLPTDGFAFDDIELIEVVNNRLTLTLPATANEGADSIDATLLALPAPATDLTVTLASSDRSEATVPETITIPAGQSTVTVPVTLLDDALLDGTQSVTITATAPLFTGAAASFGVTDNETATITLNIPALATEDVSDLTGTVTFSAPAESNVAVTLTSSEPADLQVPAVVTVVAGQTSAIFTLTPVDDTRIEGPITVTVTAHVANWIDGTANIEIADNELRTLAIQLPGPVNEGDGPRVGTVQISGTMTSPLVVNLASGDTSEITVPATVVIPAGQFSADFTATIVDDADTDGAQSALLTASAPGFSDGTLLVSVADNDPHHFTFGTISSPQYSGATFLTTITARDVNGVVAAGFNGTASLSAASGAGNLSITPNNASAFANGLWTGSIAVNQVASAVVLRAARGAAVGQSNSFNVFAPPVQAISLLANDLLYDAGTQRIYASTPTGSLVPIEPATAAVGAPIALGTTAGKLARSDDGRYLYVAIDNGVRRFDLPSQSPGLQWSLGVSGGGTPLQVGDLAVVPGSAESVAVVKKVSGSSEHVAIYDNGVQRPVQTTYPDRISAIEFGSSAAALFGHDHETSEFGFRSLSVTPLGVLVTNLTASLIPDYSTEIAYDAGRIYASTGRVIDPVTRRLVATIGASGLVVPDATADRVFFLTGSGLTWNLRAFSTSTFREIGSLEIPGVSGTPTSLIRWGREGLAFRTSGGQLYLLRASTLVPSTGGADLAVAQIGAPEPATVGRDLTYTLQITNQGLATAENVTVTDTLPAGVALVSATASQGTCSQSGGVVTASLGALANRAAATVVIVVRSAAAGTLTNTASVTASTPDPNTANNAVSRTSTVAAAVVGTRITKIPLATSDLVFDRSSGKIFASVPSSVAGFGNSVVPIDPVTGAVGAPVLVGSNPGRLASAGGSDRLFVGIDGAAGMRWLAAGGQLPGPLIPFGNGLSSGPILAADLEPVPGNPDAVAISLRNISSSPAHEGVAVFDLGVRRPMATPAQQSGSPVIAFAGPANPLFGYNNESSEFGFRTMSLSPAGVAITDTTPDLISGLYQDIVGEGGRIYSTNGKVIDPINRVVLATLAASGPVRPDATINRVFFLTGSGSTLNLLAFDTATFAEIGAVQITGVTGTAGSLVRWGAHGLAFRTSSGQVFIVESAAFVPPAASALTLPPIVSEGAGQLPGAGRIVLASPAATEVIFALNASAATVGIPATVTIPAGQQSVTFDLTISDNSELDGTRQVTITAAASGRPAVQASIDILDDENAAIGLSFAASGLEGTTVQGTVTLSSAPTVAVSIPLASTAPSLVALPANVIIPANQLSAQFPIQLADDDVLNGPRTVTISATLGNWAAATRNLEVLDNETPTLIVQLPGQLVEGAGELLGAGTVSLSGTSAVALTVGLASSVPGALQIPASVVIPAGQKTASFDVTVVDNGASGGSQNLTITASAAGFTSGSKTVTVLDDDPDHFTFAFIPSPQSGGQPIAVAITARDASNAPVAYFRGLANLSATAGGGAAAVQPASVQFAAGVWTGPVVLAEAATNARIVCTAGTATGMSDPFDVLAAPDIEVVPGSISVTLLSGEMLDRTFDIRNLGGSPLHWTLNAETSAFVGSVIDQSPAFQSDAAPSDTAKTLARTPPARPEASDLHVAARLTSGASDPTPAFVLPLQTVLTNLNQKFAAVTGNIPSRYDFSDGVSGTNIGDGGNDMYDGGNYLGTNLGSAIPYSDNLVTASAALDGASYFTRKFDGLFVFAANVVGAVNYFEITGNLGADGSGSVDAAVLSVTRGGVTYRGFVKRVHGTSDPSVNHLIIVADNGSVAHEFSTDTNDDYHRVTSLGGVTRIYHLLYAGTAGAYINNAAALNLMDAFLAAIGTPDWFAPLPSEGTVAAGAAQTITLSFNASRLPAGFYGATLSIASNDPDQPKVTVPISMQVTGAPALLAAPSPLDFGAQAGPVTRDLTITSNGSSPLTVNSIAVTGAQFSVPATAAFTLAPGETRTIPVTFTPLNLTTSAGSLVVASNSTSQPTLAVPLTARGSVHHFAWETVSDQTVDTPFLATVTARDVADNVISGFNGTARFAGATPLARPQIGTGTNTTSRPLYGSAHDVRTQVIYLADEIGGAGRITGLALYVGTAGAGTFNAWTIRLKHTALAQFATGSWDGAGWTEVYRASLTSSATGWVTFPFTTPFDYDGTSNLMVDFSFDNAATTGTSYCRYTFQSSAARVVYGSSNSTAGDPRLWSGATGGYPSRDYSIPHLQLIAEEFLPISPLTSGAFVNGAWTGQVSMPFASAATRLSAEDDAGHRGLSNTFAARETTLPNAVLPFAETFESGTLSPAWKITGTNTYRTQVTTANGPRTGTRHLTMDESAYSYNSRNEATLTLNLIGYSDVTLTFWAKEFNDTPHGPPAAPFVGGADFDGVAISADGVNWYEVQPLRTLTPNWTQLTVDLDAALTAHGLSYTSSFKIRFNQYGYAPISSNGIAIDDIAITGNATGRLSTTLPAEATEGVGTLTGSVTLPSVRATDTVVTLASGAPAKVTVPASMTIPAGALSAEFSFEVLDDPVFDGIKNVAITASTAGLQSGSATLQIFDNDLPTLVLAAPAATTEGVTNLTGSLNLGAAPASPLTFNLVSSDTSELQVPAAVTFQPGQTTAPFAITVVNDSAIDGPQNVTLTASAPGWVPAATIVSVADNETANLSLSGLSSLVEGQSTTAYLYLSGSLPEPLVVTLVNTDPGELTIPATVTVPAGQTVVNFNASAVNDIEQDGTQTVIVVASAPGFGPATAVVSVLDDEVHHFTFTSQIGGSQIANKTFNTSIEARDINNATISTFSGPVQLTAAGTGGSVGITPTTVMMSFGWWSGNVAITAPGTGVTITAASGEARGVSNSFDVGLGTLDHLAWSAIGGQQTVGLPISATVTARDSYGNPLPGITETAFVSAGMPARVTGTENGQYIFLFSSATQQRDQAIYLPAEVGPAGRIASLGLRANIFSATGGTLSNFTIRMKHTALTGYGSTPAWENTGWTTVYQGNLAVTGTGTVWVNVPLTAPFDYDGTSNLMVDFTHNGSATVSANCVSTTKSNLRTLYASGSSYADPLTWSGTSNPAPSPSTGLPNLRLGFAGTLPLTPTSITLTNGVWSGAVTVQQVAAGLALTATTASGVRGESNVFDIVGNPSLQVTPADGLSATGNFGGPFTPNVATYTLTNIGNAPLTWTAAHDAEWLNLSSTGGALAVGASTTVTATVAATTTEPGSYSGTLTFTNLANGVGNTTRPLNLTVVLPAPVLAAEPPITGGTSNTLSWSAVPGAMSYEVEAATDLEFTNPLSSGPIPTTSHTFNTLTDGQTYHFRVRARRTMPGSNETWTHTGTADFALSAASNVNTSAVAGNAAGTTLAAKAPAGTQLHTIPAIVGQPSIRLRARLATTNPAHTPRLDDGSISWQSSLDTEVTSAWSDRATSAQDNTAPAVTVTSSPTSSSYLHLLTGTASDASGLQPITINGERALTSDALASWTFPSVLKNGTNLFQIVVRDTAEPPNITMLNWNVLAAFADLDLDGLPDAWETDHGLDTNNDTGRHGADGDFDGDGLSNAFEYAANLDPSAADSTPGYWATVETKPEDGRKYLVFHHRQRIGLFGWTVAIETSPNVTGWDAAASLYEEADSPTLLPDGDTRILHHRVLYPVDAGTDARGFVRLRVTAQ